MKEEDTETIIQRALEKHPDERPRIISDNGPQFIAKDFKEFVRLVGITHVRTSPYYPQSNGKIERWHKSLKSERFRLAAPETEEQAKRVVENYVKHYNEVRLHSAIGYITPADKLLELEQAIFAERDRKLEEARERRRQQWKDEPLATEHRERLAGVQGGGNEPHCSPESLTNVI